MAIGIVNDFSFYFQFQDPGDLEGWSEINADDKETILKLIRAHESFASTKKSPAKKKTNNSVSKASPSKAANIKTSPEKKKEPPRVYKGDPQHKDNSFREFRRLVANIADTPSYLNKSELVRTFFNKGSDKVAFKGDLYVWVRLLLPGVIKRIYNLQSKQLVKIFSRIFDCNEKEMLTDLESGDVAETVSSFFNESNSSIVPAKKSALNLPQVDEFLNSLSELTKEDDQFKALSSIASKCTANDLNVVVKLIKGDLRMHAGKHICFPFT